jgi:hypothetical protein
MKKNLVKWWGTFPAQESQALFWEIGPLQLGIERHKHEWRIASNSTNDTDKFSIQIAVEESPTFSKKNLEFRRYVFSRTTPNVTLTPVLADRSQVSRAEIPFYISADEQATIYVSSPVWVKIEVGANAIKLDDIPTMRLSDTWHGPNTREGELCYASRTFCRTNLEELTVRANRVLTPVIIHNHDKYPLLIEQLSIPLPFLSVFVDPVTGTLWTEEIVIRNEPHHKHSVRQGKGAPHIAPSASLLSQPRMVLKQNNFINLFYSLLAE